jgi:hypothetical protein
MIVVIKQNEPRRERAANLRGTIAVVIALVALAVAVGTWFWLARQAAQVAIGVPHGVIAIGSGAFIAALVAAMRTMSLSDVLDLIWAAFVGILALIGAVLRGIWGAFLSLIGWD